MVTNKKKPTNNIRTLKDLHNSLPNPNYATMNSKGGIGSIKQPNFVTKKRKAKDGHLVYEINYTEK